MELRDFLKFKEDKERRKDEEREFSSPIAKFEFYKGKGQLNRLMECEVYQELDKEGKVEAVSDCVDAKIGQLDRLGMTLYAPEATFRVGSKLIAKAAALKRAKGLVLSYILDDEPIDENIVSIVSYISDSDDPLLEAA